MRVCYVNKPRALDLPTREPTIEFIRPNEESIVCSEHESCSRQGANTTKSIHTKSELPENHDEPSHPSLGNMNFFPGDRVQLLCRAPGSKPPARLDWILNGWLNLSQPLISRASDSANSSLPFQIENQRFLRLTPPPPISQTNDNIRGSVTNSFTVSGDKANSKEQTLANSKNTDQLMRSERKLTGAHSQAPSSTNSRDSLVEIPMAESGDPQKWLNPLAHELKPNIPHLEQLSELSTSRLTLKMNGRLIKILTTKKLHPSLQAASDQEAGKLSKNNNNNNSRSSLSAASGWTIVSQSSGSASSDPSDHLGARSAIARNNDNNQLQETIQTMPLQISCISQVLDRKFTTHLNIGIYAHRNQRQRPPEHLKYRPAPAPASKSRINGAPSSKNSAPSQSVDLFSQYCSLCLLIIIVISSNQRLLLYQP